MDSIVAAAIIGTGSITGSLSDKGPFIQHMHQVVTQIIQNSDGVPGLSSDAFNKLKVSSPGITDRWNELVTKGILEIDGTDEEVRPYFVALQAIVEYALANELKNQVSSLTGVIHTPAPATPLCTEGEVSKELVDSSIVDDPMRLFTVKARTTILRDYLHKGGDLYCAYPKDGMGVRSKLQQEIYLKEIEKNASHLFDRPLDCATIDPNLVGAFYLFKDNLGKTYAFAIKMTQANNPQEKGNFGLWFGEADKSPIKDRISDVQNNFLKNSIPLNF